MMQTFKIFRFNPDEDKEPYYKSHQVDVVEGMTILEPGCGMGFWTLDAARLAGPDGRVVAVDLQPRMLAALKQRAEKTRIVDRIELREWSGKSLCVDDLEGRVDLESQ